MMWCDIDRTNDLVVLSSLIELFVNITKRSLTSCFRIDSLMLHIINCNPNACFRLKRNMGIRARENLDVARLLLGGFGWMDGMHSVEKVA